MDPQLIVFFTEEEYVVAEDEGAHSIEFKNGMETSDQEASEGVEFFQIINDQFGRLEIIRVKSQIMMRLEDIEMLRKIQLAEIFRWLLVVLVYFANYFVCYHRW